MKMNENILGKAYCADEFRKDAQQVTEIIAEHLKVSQSRQQGKTIQWASPEEQLQFWQEDFASSEAVDLPTLWENVFSHSINFHNKGYMGHQFATTLPLTALTSAIIGYLNNCTTVYELGMAGNAMEKVVIGHLAEKFGYNSGSTGFVTSGGSLGNLTALVTARTSSGIPPYARRKNKKRQQRNRLS